MNIELDEVLGSVISDSDLEKAAGYTQPPMTSPYWAMMTCTAPT
jgi:hypothetical protein